MQFVKATRTRAFIKMAVTGPSGSGKTLSSLKIARGLAGDGKIALIDTENESASLYADATDFDTCPIAAPFTTEKYIQAIKADAESGYSVLVIDSLTHAWAGEGGLLAQKESLDARGGNSFTNWGSITKKHESFKAEILQAPIHVIATMRSKHEYVVEQGANGKTAPKKMGTAPIQRDGMEYEFTLVLDMAANHEFAASKDRTGLFDGKFEIPKECHGAAIRAWLESGAEPAPLPEAVDPEKLIAAMTAFADEAHKIGLDVDNEQGKPIRKKMVPLLEKIYAFFTQNQKTANPELPHCWFNAVDHMEGYAKQAAKTPNPKQVVAPAVEADEEELKDPFEEEAKSPGELFGPDEGTAPAKNKRDPRTNPKPAESLL